PEDRPASMAEIAAAIEALSLTVPDSPWPQTLSVPRPERSSLAISVSLPPRVERVEKTVAVLPFTNAGAPEDQYLAEELSDDLVDALSMTRGLKVRARATVLRVLGTDRDPCHIGRDLGVQVVVAGSVRRAGGRVRISARLITV